MTDNEKRANFQRLFPEAVEKLLHRLEIVKKKSAKGSYSWDQDLVHDTWVQIARAFAETADAFGVRFEVLVDGTEVDFVEPKSTKKRNKS
jgi:hypothetical protein